MAPAFTEEVGTIGRRNRSMSALGQKHTSAPVHLMSALPPKADIDRACGDVCFVPKADIHAVKEQELSGRNGADNIVALLGLGSR